MSFTNSYFSGEEESKVTTVTSDVSTKHFIFLFT